MPKLTYRNTASCPSSPAIENHPLTINTALPAVRVSSAASSQSEQGAMGRLPQDRDRERAYGSPTPGTLDNTAALASNKAKKKGNGLFSFLTVKEPSTQAWLDYQDDLKKQQPTQRGRVTAVGMPMVSSAKLPATVPKVNSKWDGVPEAVVQREKERKARLREMSLIQAKHMTDVYTGGSGRISRSSSRSSRGSRNTKRHHNSIASLTTRPGNVSDSSFGPPPATASSAASSRADFPVTPPSIDAHDYTSIVGQSMKSGPGTPGSEHGAFPHSMESLKIHDEQYTLRLPAMPTIPRKPNPSASPGTIPIRPSTVTPPERHSTLPNSAPSVPAADIPTHTSDLRTTVLTIPPHDHVILRSSGPGILGPPMSARRHPRPSDFPAGEAQQVVVPDVQPQSILRTPGTPRKVDEPHRPSLSSYLTKGAQLATPGTRASPQAITPLTDGDDAERSTTPTPTAATKTRNRKSRMSFFKS
ncbi:hypothetical protein MMC19_003078 [Ptychographa xylographoides]|nr:hypothetical protein [Ptychographa xylographoides]